MKAVNTHEAKTQFSRLLRVTGEENRPSQIGVFLLRGSCRCLPQGPNGNLGLSQVNDDPRSPFDAPLPEDLCLLSKERGSGIKRKHEILAGYEHLAMSGHEHKLNQKARELLSASATELYLSAASSWEIAISTRWGRSPFQNRPRSSSRAPSACWVSASLGITHFHSLAAGELPPHHRDPFDRMLIAQARMENMVLLQRRSRTFLKFK